MSQEYSGQDPLDIARAAERDLNSHEAKQGHLHTTARTNTNQAYSGASDSVNESGIDVQRAERFPGGTATYGSAASGAGNNREIPPSEGGGFDDAGKPTKARDFEGVGGPEDKARIYADENPGNDDVRENVRQGGETRRPLGGGGSNRMGDL